MKASSFNQISRICALAEKILTSPLNWDEDAQTTALTERLDILKERLRQADGRLILGLLGGTGVGKSTLISALAAEEISAASAIRPTTSRPVIYLHESFPVNPIEEALVVTHRAAPLADIAIIDFPDFDSYLTAHHQRVISGLKYLDLIIWVTDYHKYADARLYQFIKEFNPLAPAAQSAILNKMDELAARHPQDSAAVTDELVDDFFQKLKTHADWSGPKPWPVSAYLGLKNQADPAAGLAPFRQFLDNLKEQKTRRKIEEANLTFEAARLAESIIGAATPEKWLAELNQLDQLRQTLDTDDWAAQTLAAGTAEAAGFIKPEIDQLKLKTTGLMRFLTDLGDFIKPKFKNENQDEQTQPQFEPAGLIQKIAGRHEDFKAAAPKAYPPLDPKTLGAEIAAAFRKRLDEAFGQVRPAKGPGGLPIWLWIFVGGFILVWAETGGQFSGVSQTLAAAIRSVTPWLIWSSAGAFFICRFVWFRLKRRFEEAWQEALAAFGADLKNKMAASLGQPADSIINNNRQALNILADLTALDKEIKDTPND